jgi:hypothetical protein
MLVAFRSESSDFPNLHPIGASFRLQYNSSVQHLVHDRIGGPKGRNTPCPSPETINQSEKLVVCDKQRTLRIHRNVISRFSVIHSEENVNHNPGRLRKSINERE